MCPLVLFCSVHDQLVLTIFCTHAHTFLFQVIKCHFPVYFSFEIETQLKSLQYLLGGLSGTLRSECDDAQFLSVGTSNILPYPHTERQIIDDNK